MDKMENAGSTLQESGHSFREHDVRNWRIVIDGFISAVDTQFLPSREVSLCKTSLQKAKAWLGEVLKGMGTQNPYPNSTNPENKTIDPQAEHGLSDHVPYTVYGTQVERVKAIRQDIQNLLDEMLKCEYGIGYKQKEVSEQNLIEAKHWMGWELDRIRVIQETEGLNGEAVKVSISLY